MISKRKKAVILIFVLFFSGNLFAFIGLAKGSDIAVSLSRPYGADAWTTSGEMTAACTYVPLLLGVSLIIASIIFSALIVNDWIKQNTY